MGHLKIRMKEHVVFLDIHRGDTESMEGTVWATRR
jgi:hypothetical protein